MAAWTSQRTAAHQSIGTALGVVDSILSYANDGRGKPSAAERALFAASVAFTYGIWENYVEQLAIEIVEHISGHIEPENVPDQVRRSLEKKSTWELTVSPGWRTLWVRHVRVQAVGNNDDKFGMNTARSGQVRNLFLQAGVNDPFDKLKPKIVPAHLKGKTVEEAIDALVELRGEIVHTGSVPDTLRKAHVRDWRSFVANAADGIDDACRAECKRLYS